MQPQLKNKLAELQRLISSYKNAVVAFSGGIDSTLLLKTTYNILNSGTIAVTVISELLPASELAEARQLVKCMGVQHLVIPSEELYEPKFTINNTERCYYCKYLRYKKLLSIAKEKGLYAVLDGTNADDNLDFRPGTRAIQELGIKTPLRDVGLTKEEIRMLSQYYGLENWQKPSTACLASRIPYGESITKEKLLIVERAEEYLKGLGLGQLRVRHHGTTARIEVEPRLFTQVVEASEQIVKYLKSLGYIYVTMDLQGFRSGSMNEQK